MQNFLTLKTQLYLLQDLDIGSSVVVFVVARYLNLLLRGSWVQSPVRCPATDWCSSVCPEKIRSGISVYVADSSVHIPPNSPRAYYHSPTHNLEER
jgi:hypothetical protein